MTDQDVGDFNQNVHAHYAKYELAALAESRGKLIDKHSAAFRCLVASLLAVNGGSALALFNSLQIEPFDKIWSGAAFAFGIFTALLCAYLSQGASRRMMDPLAVLSGFWIEVSAGGLFDVTRYAEVLEKIKEAQAASFSTRLAGWLSAMAFVIGVIIVGHALVVLGGHTKKADFPEGKLRFISQYVYLGSSERPGH